MNRQLQEFFFAEQEQGRLNFESFPEYNHLLHQSLVLFPDGDLPAPIFDLLETTNFISFAHGLKLGLQLRKWAGS